MEGVVEPEGDFAGASAVMVDWEEEREKVFASGARCVSFNSAVCQRHNVGIECCSNAAQQQEEWADNNGNGGDILLVSFHDMAAMGAGQISPGVLEERGDVGGRRGMKVEARGASSKSGLPA